MSASSGCSSQRPITGLFSAAPPTSVRSIGGKKPFGGADAPNCKKNAKLSRRKSPRATSCLDTATSESTGRLVVSTASPSRSMRSDDATSVSQL